MASGKEREPDGFPSRTKNFYNEDMKCAVCHDVYKNPHLLPCFHSFCKACLDKVKKPAHHSLSYSRTSMVIKCPTCKKEHSLSDKGPLQNPFLASKVEELVRADAGPSRSCEQCNSSEVVIFCSRCDNFLCSKCLDAHKRMAAFREHRNSLLEPTKAKKTKLREYQCSEHTKEILRVYCRDCNEVICRDCALFSHRNHDLKPAEKAAVDIKEELSSCSISLNDRMKTFESHNQTVAKVEQHITTYPDQLKVAIASTFDKLKAAIEERKQVLLNEVDVKYTAFSKKLEAEKKTLDMTMSSLRSGIRFADLLKEDENLVEVVFLGIQAVSFLDDLKNASWDSKAVKELGPMVYLKHDPKKPTPSDCLQFIRSIGHMANASQDLNRDFDLTPKGYSSSNRGAEDYFSLYATPKHMYQENGMFTVLARCSFDLLCPVTLSVQITLNNADDIPSTVLPEDEHWKITFHTPKPGKYNVKAELKIGKGILKEKVLTIELHTRSHRVYM